MTKLSRYALIPVAAALAAGLAGCNTNDTKPLKLQATSTAVMQGGSAVSISASGGRKNEKISWRLLAGATGTLEPSGDTRSALYTPSESIGGTLSAQSIEAKMGEETQTIAVQLQAAPASEALITLPAWYQAFPNPPSGSPIIKGEPRGFAPDGNGGYYVTYAPPALKLVRVKAGADPVEMAGLGGQGIIGATRDGALYLVEGSAVTGLTVRKRGADGKLSVLTRTAPYNSKLATVDGPSGTATASYPRFVLDSSANMYALDGTKVRKIAADGSWGTIAGDGCDMGDAPKCPASPVAGKGSSARLSAPLAIASDPSGTLYVADGVTILKVTQAGDVTILAGGKEGRSIDGDSGSGRFSLPFAVTADGAGNVYVLDDGKLRRIASSGAVTTVATGLGKYDPAHPELITWSLHANDNGTVDYLRAVDIRRVKVQ